MDSPQTVLGVLALLGALGFGLYWYIQEVKLWREIHASAGHRPDATIRLHEHLRRNGIRCKLKVLGGLRHEGYAAQTVSLRVHRDDVSRAYYLMSQMPQ